MAGAVVRHLARAVAGGVAVLGGDAARAGDAPPAIDAEISYVGDSMASLKGERGMRYMGLLDMMADVDGDAIGLDGLSAHVNLQWAHGGAISGDVVGDGQGVSNIEAPPGLRPLQAYVAARIGGGRGQVKAGLIDLNDDFDEQAVGAMFLNSSHGIGADFAQTGLNGPSIFPTTASAVVMRWTEPGWSVRLGLFDGVSGDPDHPRRTVVRFPGESGLLMVGEVDLALDDDTQLQLGAWRYTRSFDAVDGGARRLSGNSGAYVMGQTMVLSRGEQRLDAWLRLGIANSAINPVGAYLGGGLTYGGDRSSWGLAFAHARLGDPALRAGAGERRAETNVELSWAFRLNDRLTIQPDVQYIFNPGWAAGRADALVVGLRFGAVLF